jgi:hypothetical protein
MQAITVKEDTHMKKFLISAKSPKFYKKKAMVITVNFSNIHERECEHNKENLEESDYEEWIPHTIDEGGCLDGRKVMMVRKKPSRKCFNPENFTMFFMKQTCKCTDDDYHCDFGYAYDDEGRCVIDPEINDSTSNAQPPQCEDFFYKSDGYRRNYETYCEGGVSHKSTRISCSGKHWYSFSLGNFHWFGLKYVFWLLVKVITFNGLLSGFGWIFKLFFMVGFGYGLFLGV